MEIGSLLELDEWELYGVPESEHSFELPFMKKDKKYRTVFYQSGRNAIEALLLFLREQRGITKILSPDYMCETVTDAAKRAGILIENYQIDREYCFVPEEIESKLQKGACLFVAHFFGRKIEGSLLTAIEKWKSEGVIVIEDITMSLFSSDEKGIGFGSYTLGSIRKWLPVPDGGFLASDAEEMPEELESSCVSKYVDFSFVAQRMKRDYIQGSCVDKKLKKIYMDYYGLSIKELFSDYRLYPMSDWTKNYLQNCDVNEIVQKRMSNYDYLYQRLSEIEGITLKTKREEGYLPLGMVIQTTDRDELLKYLIENDIYCNVHWRLNLEEASPECAFLSTTSITIPCDQRYGFAEMDYIADVMERWKKR